jgi:hypothetical protein
MKVNPNNADAKIKQILSLINFFFSIYVVWLSIFDSSVVNEALLIDVLEPVIPAYPKLKTVIMIQNNKRMFEPSFKGNRLNLRMLIHAIKIARIKEVHTLPISIFKILPFAIFNPMSMNKFLLNELILKK